MASETEAKGGDAMAATEGSPAYDFSGLTPNQCWLILYQGWRSGQKWPDGTLWPQPSKRAVKRLIDRGLMTERLTICYGVMIKEYHVPPEVHLAYCEHCVESESRKGDRP